DQHDPGSQLLVAFQCDAKRKEPFRNSLAVIEPIHAKDKLGARKGGAYLPGSLRHVLGGGSLFKRLVVDADRKTAHADLAFIQVDKLNPTARENFSFEHHMPDTLQKVAEVTPCLEPKQVELEQGTQQSLLLRELREDVV